MLSKSERVIFMVIQIITQQPKNQHKYINKPFYQYKLFK